MKQGITKTSEQNSNFAQSMSNLAVGSIFTKIQGVNKNGFFRNISIDTENNIKVNNQKSAFGEISQSINNPVVQIDSIYGLKIKDIETFNNNGGSVSGSNGIFECQTGTNIGGYGVIRSKRKLRYRPGQGGMCRFTASFSNGVENSLQMAGMFTSTNGLWVGVDGSNGFGICRRSAGSLEIRTLTITSPATTASNITITLNDIVHIIPLTVSTLRQNCYEISTFGFTGNWNIYQVGDTVIFQSTEVGLLSGAFTYDSGTTGSVGSFTQTQPGALNIENWVYQSDFNHDVLDGTNNSNNPSGMTLNYNNLNVYQIDYQYLGAGRITFYIENDNTGNFVPMHCIYWSNNYNIQNIKNPSMPVGWTSASLGSNTNLSVKGVSAALFVQGVINQNRNPSSLSNTKSGVTSTLTNILSIRCGFVYGDTINHSDINIYNISVGADGTKNVIIGLYLNPNLGGIPNWEYLEKNESNCEYDISSTTVTNGRSILTFVLGKTESNIIDLSKLNLKLQRGDVLTIGAQTISGTSDVTSSISFVED